MSGTLGGLGALSLINGLLGGGTGKVHGVLGGSGINGIISDVSGISNLLNGGGLKDALSSLSPIETLNVLNILGKLAPIDQFNVLNALDHGQAEELVAALDEPYNARNKELLNMLGGLNPTAVAMAIWQNHLSHGQQADKPTSASLARNALRPSLCTQQTGTGISGAARNTDNCASSRI